MHFCPDWAIDRCLCGRAGPLPGCIKPGKSQGDPGIRRGDNLATATGF